MVCRSALVIALAWGIVGSIDAAQVAGDSKPGPKQSLRRKRIPAEDQEAPFDDNLLSSLTDLDSSNVKPGRSQQINNLLRLASGKERLDPAAFDSLFEQLRADRKIDLNNSMRDIESDYDGHIDNLAACETNHGFHAPGQRYTEYRTAEGSYEHAVNASEQACSTRDDSCEQQRIKGINLHNYVQNEIVGVYPSAAPTVFGLSDFPLRDIDDVAVILQEKHTAWATAAGLCSSAETTCGGTLQEVDRTCGEVNTAASYGRTDYNGCYQQKKGVLDGYDVTGKVETQKTLIRNLEKVLCIVKTAVDSHGDTPKTDGEVACSDLGAPGPGLIMYKCVCTSASSQPTQKYSETYIAQLTLTAEPNMHTAWEKLGCANRQISTTAVPPTQSQD
jgi:hypothetical protein